MSMHDLPHLSPFVAEAIAEMRRAFGDDATVDTDLVDDPENAGCPPTIFVVASTHLSVDEAEQRLSTVVDGWWARHYARGLGRVSLSVDFVQPPG